MTRSRTRLSWGLSPVQGLLLLAMVGLGSCATSPVDPATSTAPQVQSQPTASAGIKVVTSTLPVTNFAKAVVGDRGQVTYLLPTSVGPHDYQAKPEDVRTLAEATVLVKNGLGIDEYLDSLIENANNRNLKIIDTSQGVQTIANEEEPAHEEEAGHHHEGEFNPHIWLDPERAVQQVENIRDGLIAADPAGEATYRANAAAYIDQLNALDSEIKAALQPYAGKEFVTYHDFAPYFAEQYNLKAEFLVGVPEENPAPADVQRVLKSAQASDLKTLLTEPQAVGNPFEALAKDLKVQVSSFDPMETSSPSGLEPDHYFVVMRQNLKNLQAAFGSAQSRLPEGALAYLRQRQH